MREIDKSFVQLYQTKEIETNSGATWLYIVLKKRELIKKNREVIPEGISFIKHFYGT